MVYLCGGNHKRRRYKNPARGSGVSNLP
jgi:hypothetical protein